MQAIAADRDELTRLADDGCPHGNDVWLDPSDSDWELASSPSPACRRAFSFSASCANPSKAALETRFGATSAQFLHAGRHLGLSALARVL